MIGRTAALAEGLMVAIWAAAGEASATGGPCCPINARLHPSDSTPWTILLVLTLIIRCSGNSDVHDAMVRLLVLSFSAPGAGTQTLPPIPH